MPSRKEILECIQTVAADLRCVVHLPDYYGKKGDKGTILLYSPEAAAHNREVDKEPTHYSNMSEARMYGCYDWKYIYKPHFWSFESSDMNGAHNPDWGNHGTLDLRSLYWQKVVEGSLRYEYARLRQNERIAEFGGLAFLPEADDVSNDLSVEMVRAYAMHHGTAYLVKINDGEPVTAYKEGMPLPNFVCDYVTHKADPLLALMIRDYRKTGKGLPEITNRIIRTGGAVIIWR